MLNAKWCITPSGSFYQGDLIPGDRYATEVEVTQLKLDSAKKAKLDELYSTCGEIIISGFWSSALGAEHLYPTKQTDQLNLTALVTLSMYPGVPPDWQERFWCMDVDGVWDMRFHSGEQLRHVAADVSLGIKMSIKHKADLEALVHAATTIEEVNAVVWF